MKKETLEKELQLKKKKEYIIEIGKNIRFTKLGVLYSLLFIIVVALLLLVFFRPYLDAYFGTNKKEDIVATQGMVNCKEVTDKLNGRLLDMETEKVSSNTLTSVLKNLYSDKTKDKIELQIQLSDMEYRITRHIDKVVPRAVENVIDNRIRSGEITMFHYNKDTIN